MNSSVFLSTNLLQAIEFLQILKGIFYEGKFYELYEKSVLKILDLIPYCKYSEEKKNKTEKKIKYDLGCHYSNNYKISKSIEIHEELLEYYRSTKNEDDIQMALHALGTAYLTNKEYDKVSFFITFPSSLFFPFSVFIRYS